MKASCPFLVLNGVVGFMANSTHAQAPINSDVALQPSADHLIIRQQFRYFEAGDDPSPLDRKVKVIVAPTTFVYGVTDDFTLLWTTPLVYRELKIGATGAQREDFGVADLTFLSKFRLFRDDFGPTNTRRFDLIGGVEIRSGDSNFTSDSYDPILGGVFTHVEGRHAVSSDLLWKFNTGGGPASVDQMKYDLAYIFRLTPETYPAQHPTALNSVLELNGLYETNSDNELFLSPGMQFVTTRWIAEATVQLPIWQDVGHRLTADFVIGLSFRIQF